MLQTKVDIQFISLEASVLQDKPFPKVDVVFKYGVNQEVTRVIAKEGKKFKELKEALMPYVRRQSSSTIPNLVIN